MLTFFARLCTLLGLRLRPTEEEQWVRSSERALRQWMRENVY